MQASPKQASPKQETRAWEGARDTGQGQRGAVGTKVDREKEAPDGVWKSPRRGHDRVHRHTQDRTTSVGRAVRCGSRGHKQYSQLYEQCGQEQPGIDWRGQGALWSVCTADSGSYSGWHQSTCLAQPRPWDQFLTLHHKERNMAWKAGVREPSIFTLVMEACLWSADWARGCCVGRRKHPRDL